MNSPNTPRRSDTGRVRPRNRHSRGRKPDRASHGPSVTSTLDLPILQRDAAAALSTNPKLAHVSKDVTEAIGKGDIHTAVTLLRKHQHDVSPHFCANVEHILGRLYILAGGFDNLTTASGIFERLVEARRDAHQLMRLAEKRLAQGQGEFSDPPRSVFRNSGSRDMS